MPDSPGQGAPLTVHTAYVWLGGCPGCMAPGVAARDDGVVFGSEVRRLRRIAEEITRIGFGVVDSQVVPAGDGLHAAIVMNLLGDVDPTYGTEVRVDFREGLFAAYAVGLGTGVLRRPAPIRGDCPAQSSSARPRRQVTLEGGSSNE